MAGLMATLPEARGSVALTPAKLPADCANAERREKRRATMGIGHHVAINDQILGGLIRWKGSAIDVKSS